MQVHATSACSSFGSLIQEDVLNLDVGAISYLGVGAIKRFPVGQEAAHISAGRLLRCRCLSHHAKLPLLRKLTRNGGVLGKKQILGLIISPIRVHWIRPEDHLKGRVPTGRNHGVQAPWGLRKNLSPWVPLIRN